MITCVEKREFFFFIRAAVCLDAGVGEEGEIREGRVDGQVIY